MTTGCTEDKMERPNKGRYTKWRGLHHKTIHPGGNVRG